MGKWDRRWMPRRRYNRKYRDYDYEEPPPSPPSPHHPQSNPPPIQDNNGSSWEIDFCKSVRVPWKKVVAAKHYMYCYDNVAKWDDSASEEAFNDAKKRYWEKINCLPYETPLPDKDLYIDEINWNPDIDPELISDLDREFFNPDVGKSDTLWTRAKIVNNAVLPCASVQNNENPDSELPWESDPALGVGTLKDTPPHWDQNTKSINSKDISNPWEQSCTPLDDSLKNNAWKGSAGESPAPGVKDVDPWEQSCPPADESLWNNGRKGCPEESWGWRKESMHNRWSTNNRNAGDRGWTHVDNRSGVRKQRNFSSRDQQYPVNTGNTWQRSFPSHTGALWGRRGWKEYGDNSGGWKQPEVQKNQPKNMNYEGPFGGERAVESGCKKREGSLQYSSRYKTSRCQGDDYMKVQKWQ